MLKSQDTFFDASHHADADDATRRAALAVASLLTPSFDTP